jgi:hypothetical protein
MRYGLVGSVISLGLLAQGSAGVPKADEPAGKGPAWLSDYAAARRVARANGKPIFAVFR